MPRVRNLFLDNAGQFKNEVLEYVTGNPAIQLVNVRLRAPNLISDEAWRKFFEIKGQRLETVQLDNLDGHFDDDTFASMVKHCPNLKRLKLEKLQKLSVKSIERLGSIKQLEHLTLLFRLAGDIALQGSHIIPSLKAIGAQLRTLCLDDFQDCDASVLQAIHQHCPRLTKLRISSATRLADRDFQTLLQDWPVAGPGLTYVDLSQCRHLDDNVPSANPRGIGLCAKGFVALMTRSFSYL